MNWNSVDIARLASDSAIGAAQQNGRIVEGLVGLMITADGDGNRAWHILHLEGQTGTHSMGMVDLLDMAVKRDAFGNYFDTSE